MSISADLSVGLCRNGVQNDDSVIPLSLEVQEPVVLKFLRRFEEADRPSKALEALKVGVIAIQSAAPSLDTSIVQEKFAEVERRLKETVDTFFGKHGSLARRFKKYFHQKDGHLAKLMEAQIGPGSKFGESLDPNNKQGVIALIEDCVSKLVEDKLTQVLKEFSLDHDDSAMSRLKKTMDGNFAALGIQAARAEEAERGRVKGLDFESDLYERIAKWGRQLGDETQHVGATPGTLKQKLGKRKFGDHLIVLGKTTGAPGLKIVVEAKDQSYQLKKAKSELENAKKNREAVCGIFVFSKGCEPKEVGDFTRIGNDFYCTVDKEELHSDGPLLFLWAAYEIARAQAVAAVLKEADSQLDLERIHNSIDALKASVPDLGEIVKKANTIQKSGQAIEETAKKMQEAMKQRIEEVLASLRSEQVTV